MFCCSKACKVLCILLLPVVCILLCLRLFDVSDGIRFCALSGGEDVFGTDQQWRDMEFRFNSTSGRHEAYSLPASNNTSKQTAKTNDETKPLVCLEDIVTYVNSVRAGADGLVNTEDDQLTLEEQLELLYSLIKQYFSKSADVRYTRDGGGTKGFRAFWYWVFSLLPTFRETACASDAVVEEDQAYWVDSLWHLNHNAAVTGQMKVLYGDINEYLIFFGNRIPHGGYSGQFAFDLFDYVLEGVHYTMQTGSFERTVHLPITNLTQADPEKHRLPPSVTTEDFVPFSNVVTMPRGMQKIYRSGEPSGAILLEYGRGCASDSLLQAMIIPVFLTLDFRSLYLSITAFVASVVHNSGGQLWKYLWTAVSAGGSDSRANGATTTEEKNRKVDEL